MDFQKLIAIVALFLCSGAAADIFTVVDYVETSAANVNVPTSTNGQLTFKPCADTCDAEFVSIRLTPETEFLVRGKRVSFAEFRQAFSQLRRSEDDYTIVSYDTEKRVVTSVSVGF